MTRGLVYACSGLFALVLFSTGCMNQQASEPGEFLPGSHWFDLTVDGKPVKAQLAITDGEMTRGLMGRTDLQPDQGMLFVHRQPIRASFWMKNTPLPLDIGFFNPEGRLLEIYPLFPHDETLVRSRSDQIQFALEMNQGWFSRNAVRPGAILDQETLRSALRRRGFDPAEFGL
jgi:uncharacterized protein